MPKLQRQASGTPWVDLRQAKNRPTIKQAAHLFFTEQTIDPMLLSLRGLQIQATGPAVGLQSSHPQHLRQSQILKHLYPPPSLPASMPDIGISFRREHGESYAKGIARGSQDCHSP